MSDVLAQPHPFRTHKPCNFASVSCDQEPSVLKNIPFIKTQEYNGQTKKQLVALQARKTLKNPKQ